MFDVTSLHVISTHIDSASYKIKDWAAASGVSKAILMEMTAVFLMFSCLMASTLSSPKNDLTCNICVDVVTDIDNFITSDTTEQQIVEFVEEVSRMCHQDEIWKPSRAPKKFLF